MEGTSLVDIASGEFAEPMLVDRKTGLPLTGQHFRFVPGDNASDATRRRLGGRP